MELRLPNWAALGGGQPALALPPSFDELTASGAILLPAFNDVALPVWLMRAGSDCLPAGGTALVSALQAGPDRAVEGASNPRCRERRQHEADACGALPMRDPTTGAPRSPAAGAPAVPAVPETEVGAVRGAGAGSSAAAGPSPEQMDSNAALEEQIRQAELLQQLELEDRLLQREWRRLARTEAAQGCRARSNGIARAQQTARRLAEACQKDVRQRQLRAARELGRYPGRMRRLSREMTAFWRKADKENADASRQKGKEAAARRKQEEELREAKRQQQGLNFLLTQTELYSHFMAHKMGGAPGSGAGAKGDAAAAEAAATKTTMIVPATTPGGELTAAERAEEAGLQDLAQQAVASHVSATASRKQAFDSEAERLRLQAGSSPSAVPAGSSAPLPPGEGSNVEQPRRLRGQLKRYQVKGLKWLVGLYDQGLNGILADEMGLGKTVQAISLLAYLSEARGIKGPFLVVAPSSTLHNWDRELRQFYPDFKVLPYWGSLEDRKVNRQRLHHRKIYSPDADSVVVTSYDIIIKDEKYLRKVRWAYMVLDEAQAIKNADALRWKTLLAFSCRNRLLLTGTPVQNNMAELWALLHFIMPTLFDSHEHFNEWFSKGIESHAQGLTGLNAATLKRLHVVLQPFMLRRVKTEVEGDMTTKTEVELRCQLAPRQKTLYQRIRKKISVLDLFSGGSLSEKKLTNLMNIVVQLRKVCNHPEIFERQSETVSFYFGRSNLPPLPAAFGELDWLWRLGRGSLLVFALPKLLFRGGGLPGISPWASGTLEAQDWLRHKWVWHQLSVWSPTNLNARSGVPQSGGRCDDYRVHAGEPASWSSGFRFLRLMGLGGMEAATLAAEEPWRGWGALRQWGRRERIRREHLWSCGAEGTPRILLSGSPAASKGLRSRHTKWLLVSSGAVNSGGADGGTGPRLDSPPPLVLKPGERLARARELVRCCRSFVPPVVAPAPECVCSDASFASQTRAWLWSGRMHRELFGFAPSRPAAGADGPQAEAAAAAAEDFALGRFPEERPLLGPLLSAHGSSPLVHFYSHAKALVDSCKLRALEGLLPRLHAEGHRVLIFAQMLQVMDLIQDFMRFKGYSFLRLDGSTKIEDRKDLVAQYQEPDGPFAFIISTRAGGLGINLTAADTVVFYESDWNPTMDLQAMDRAHRLGQTRPVTVYRLVCRGTVEERILKRASQKNAVQQLVMTGGAGAGDVFQEEDIVSLLVDDGELESQLKKAAAERSAKKADLTKKRQSKRKGGDGPVRVKMNAEGEDTEAGDVELEGGAGAP